jgi:hypothetical protein
MWPRDVFRRDQSKRDECCVYEKYCRRSGEEEGKGINTMPRATHVLVLLYMRLGFKVERHAYKTHVQ